MRTTTQSTWLRVLPLCVAAIGVIIWFERAPIIRGERAVGEFARARIFRLHANGDATDGRHDDRVAIDGRESGTSTGAVGRHPGGAQNKHRFVAGAAGSPRTGSRLDARIGSGSDATPPRSGSGSSGPVMLSTRQRLERDLNTFFSVKDLDLETRGRVIDALCENRAESDDIFALSRSEGLSDSARNALLEVAFKNLSTSLHNLIGADATSELFAYQVGQRVAQPFVEQCKSAGVPLSDSAFTAIAADVGSHVFWRQRSPIADATRWAQFLDRNDAAGLAAAEKVLTPEQMNLFRAYWAQRPSRDSVARDVAPATPLDGL